VLAVRWRSLWTGLTPLQPTGLTEPRRRLLAASSVSTRSWERARRPTR